MRNTTLSSVFCLLSCLALFTARAAEPGFAFSGQLFEMLNDKSTVAQVDGKTSYKADLWLRLYDDSEGAKSEKSQALWGRRVTVNVQNGCFACELRDSAGTPIEGLPCMRLADAFARLTGSKLSVGVTAFDDANDEITPRQTLTSVPFAVCAHDALGSLGDLSVPGAVSAAGLSAQEASFGGTVTHEGTVTLQSRQTLPKLVLDDERTLVAGELVAKESAAVKNASLSALNVARLTAAVGNVGALEADSLALSGDTASVDKITPPQGTDELVVRGDVGSKAITVKDLEVESRLALFKWDDSFVELAGKKLDTPTQTYYIYNDSSASWIPTVKDAFVSLSFQMNTNTCVKVSVDSTEIAEISVKNGTGDIWMPFQTFVRKGQKISWTGANNPDGVLMTCREFGY